MRQNFLLVDQIAAAKDAFGHYKLKPTDEVFASINARLDEAIVLPEYHAYIVGAPTTSSATDAATPLVPSSDVVVGGEPIERTVNIIQDGEDMSLLVDNNGILSEIHGGPSYYLFGTTTRKPPKQW
jgi:hypothetical protein